MKKKGDDTMKKLMLLGFAAAVLVLLSWPSSVQAQVSETNQAITLLTDFPAVGGRTTVEDFTKRGGADAGVAKKAANLLQDALGKAGGNAQAKGQLELAGDYAKAGLHKEARLSAQGALYYLCQDRSGEEGCDKAPKFGSYVAP
jgi:hypothetical protein